MLAAGPIFSFFQLNTVIGDLRLICLLLLHFNWTTELSITEPTPFALCWFIFVFLIFALFIRSIVSASPPNELVAILLLALVFQKRSENKKREREREQEEESGRELKRHKAVNVRDFGIQKQIYDHNIKWNEQKPSETIRWTNLSSQLMFKIYAHIHLAQPPNPNFVNCIPLYSMWFISICFPIFSAS